MTQIEIDLNPVDDITTNAIGRPGERVFYLQAIKGDQIITMQVEKIQIQSLAVAVEQFLAQIKEENPEISEVSSHYQEAEMDLKQPVEPLFRIGDFGLGYDDANDLVILVLHEVSLESEGVKENHIVRLWCTRSQIRCMVHWGIELANRGRQICPLCGEMIDPEGHFCPKNNGHKKTHKIRDG